MTRKTILSLEDLISLVPAYIYWKDKEGFYQGCNLRHAQSVGYQSPDEVIGKTDFELFSPEVAQHIRDNDLDVIHSKKIKTVEEKLVDDGKEITVLSQKIPLFDLQGEVSGLLVLSMDISERKRMEDHARKVISDAARIKLENAAHKSQVEIQEKFKKTATQIAHDLRSPLASLLMVIKSCKEIPEMERIALREATKSIGDIANSIISQYKSNEVENVVHAVSKPPTLLSTMLLQLLNDKKLQYRDLPIKFNYVVSESGRFAFIQIEMTPFKRIISNLIHDAIDAFEYRTGVITVELDATREKVMIVIADNGKGVSKGSAPGPNNKLKENTGDFSSVQETLARSQGTIQVDTQEDVGTKITLEFPREKTPHWIAEEIRVGNDDIVVILDDDSAVHAEWEKRFDPILEKAPSIALRHFQNCHEAVRFINDLTQQEKEKVYLLTDFNLLKQELNGLHVVEKAKISRSILVTNHYADPIIFERAIKMNTRILPKQMTSEIPIVIGERESRDIHFVVEDASPKKVDLVLVDDDKSFADAVINYIFRDTDVDYFEDPNQFKESLKNYPKDTRIYLDNHFPIAGVKGLDIAKELHEQGFTRLYLLSGEIFQPGQIPLYLKVIRKDDIDNIKDW